MLALLAVPAQAFHRQTPPIVQLTTSGNTSLPRSPSGRRLVLAIGDSDRQIFRQNRSHGQNVMQQITTRGDNANPAISKNGNVLAWDSDCALLDCPEPGRQIFMWVNGVATQVTHDPTGTSVNPALCADGACLAFESSGDLVVGSNPAGTSQIFLQALDGTLSQVSQGQGASHNAALDHSGQKVVFDSTSDASGADTGISQIWLLAPPGPAFNLRSEPGGLQVITQGKGPSQRAAMDEDGRIIAFESTADLAGDQHDTGVSQIFLYDIAIGNVAQVTNDPSGCSGASVNHAALSFGGGTWSIGYACHGQGFFYQFGVGLGKHFQLPIDGGDTAQVTALGSWFRVASTTADPLAGGTTTGHEIYMLNLFKLTVIPVD